MKLPDFEYLAPDNINEAIRALFKFNGEARIISGGQSLLPMMSFRLSRPQALIDLCNISDLNKIELTPVGLSIGSRVTWSSILKSSIVKEHCPILIDAVNEIAHYQIRNRGTIGGSLAHADPAAEIPTLALSCDAIINIIGMKGMRSILAKDFFKGTLSTCLDFDEIIIDIVFPYWKKNRKWAFEEFSVRRGDFAISGVYLFLDLDDQNYIDDARIGIINITNKPTLLKLTEKQLIRKKFDSKLFESIKDQAYNEISDHFDKSEENSYKINLSLNLLKRTFEKICK
jgi:aerobic carbon-monoxide dehydrogenase medium subunit